MEKSFLYRSIFGDDSVPEPVRLVPKLPIIDDPVPLFPRAHDPRTDALIQQLERDAAIKAVCPEVWDMMKDSRPQPQLNLNTYPQLPLPVPAAESDPRKIECQCSCLMCRSGSGCWNCLGNEDGVKCEFSTLSFLDELLPVSAEQRQEEMAQAAKRQRARLAGVRIARHRKGLEPIFEKFRNAIPYGYKPSVVNALNKVHDAMAAYCVAAEG